jgi:valyl-tRNA synthetase
MELSKIYNPKNVESKWYKVWQAQNLFEPNNKYNEPFTIMMPPPNVTGILHIGHVLNHTIQDILIRKERMNAKSTLWLPGMDHASIATEAKVTKMLLEKGQEKEKIGREKFLEHAWDWKEEYGGKILNQLKRVGTSCDWSKTTFTIDPKYSESVIHAFVKLYEDNLIYKGERIINWDPKGLTALSDEEVIYKEKQGYLWHFKYPIKDSKEFIVVATTRPETMLGDTGVAINPNDQRYKHLIGRTIILPIINREIPIFADEYVDIEFGTGCVKVTPAHDPNDYEMGLRHKLEIINIFHPDAKLNENCPLEFQGIDRFKARKLIIEKLTKEGFLEKIEDYTHQVGHSERTDAIVEPYISKQWFLKMDKLAAPALKVVNEGEIKFYPERWTKTYNHWLENIKDWCISRQLWWGHRIPVWYKNDEIYCGATPPEGKGWVQDEDVLDTWFSSWLWPFSTLGWPKETPELEKFYPTNDLVTGPDIIFFWVARMIMAGLYFKNEVPFKNVYFHGIVRDAEGRKMSKSLGNSADPLDLIEQYGSDAVRVGLLLIAPAGLDILYSENKLEHGRNFMNKLWNSARFILMNTNNLKGNLPDYDKLHITDKWILSKFNNSIEKINKHYDDYKLNEVIKTIYEFVYDYFCDWYIEFTKTRFYGKDMKDKELAESVSIYVLKNILKLLHPFTPHITEEIWSFLDVDKNSEDVDNQSLLINSQSPKFNKNMVNHNIEQDIKLIMITISAIRNIKASLNIPPSKTINMYVRGGNQYTNIIQDNIDLMNRMIKIKKLEVGEKLIKPAQSATAVIENLEIFIPLKGLIDIEKEIKRLEKQVSNMDGRLNSVSKKLNNKNFVDRAPKDIIEHEKAKQADYQQQLNKLKENLNSLIK